MGLDDAPAGRSVPVNFGAIPAVYCLTALGDKIKIQDCGIFANLHLRINQLKMVNFDFSPQCFIKPS